jgi:hypothetical protein
MNMATRIAIRASSITAVIVRPSMPRDRTKQLRLRKGRAVRLQRFS